MHINDFGKLQDGYMTKQYAIGNQTIQCLICDYGATLTSLKVDGIETVCGFDSIDGYLNEEVFMGKTVGRCCNRIANGTFVLNGITYHIPINNGPNSLHGGLSGFDQKVWKVEQYSDDEITLSYVSKDQEEGYPGNLRVEVTYAVKNSQLEFSYRATSDQDTLCNITNHSYFNLEGAKSQSVLNHELKINADTIGKVDQDGCTHEETMCVEHTPFDFRTFKEIGKDIHQNHEQLICGTGYDHHYLISESGKRHFLTCKSEKLIMDIESDLPGVHVYTSNWCTGQSHGHQNNPYPKHCAICFETQYYPNAINTKNQLAPILKKGQTIQHTTIYRFTKR